MAIRAVPKKTTLYRHVGHPHKPRNPNEIHKAEREAKTGVGGFNEKLAVWITRYVGSMPTAYWFSVLALFGLLGVLNVINPSIYTLVAWLSQTFIQLVLLPVIMVGQNVNSRHGEIMAEQMFHNTVRLLHEILQLVKHLNAQDKSLIAIQELCEKILAVATKLASGVE